MEGFEAAAEVGAGGVFPATAIVLTRKGIRVMINFTFIFSPLNENFQKEQSIAQYLKI